MRRLLKESKDMVTADSVPELAEKMDNLSLDWFSALTKRECRPIRAYDAQIEQGCRYYNDEQLRRIAQFPQLPGDPAPHLLFSED
ncbi:MAG: hypothetical protein R2941_12065 [Desulfobacterales bacterium]